MPSDAGPTPAARLRPVVVGMAAAVLAVAGLLGVDALSASGEEVDTASESDVDRLDTAPGEGDAPADPAAREPGCTPAPLEQRAAQVLAVGLPRVTSPDDPLVPLLREVQVGAVFIAPYNVDSAPQVQALVDALTAGPGLPPLVTTDEESGRVSTFRDLRGRTPTPARLGQAGVAAAHTEGRATGEVLASVGVDVDLAPVADLAGPSSSAEIGDRSFGTDPLAAGAASAAYAAGLLEAGVVPTVKHFPGQGRAPGSSHGGSVTVDLTREELAARELLPFRQQIDGGAALVMLGHATYPALGGSDMPASLDAAAYALLRDELGFDGVAITDSLGMGAVNLRWNHPEAGVRAVAAGADLVLDTDGNWAPEMRDALVTAVRDGRLPEQRLDEAVGRVLALKGVDATTWTCRPAPDAAVLDAAAAVIAGSPQRAE